MTNYLELKPEQQSKIRDILESAKAELGESISSIREFGEKTRERIREVLTEEQRAKLDRLRDNARGTGKEMLQSYGPQMREGAKRTGEEARLRFALRSLNLTDEQRQRIEAVQKETAQKIKSITDEVRPKIQAARDDAKKKIDEILTPEQRAQLRLQLEKMPPVPQKGAGGKAARKPAAGGPDGPPAGGDQKPQASE